jgi:L-ascorbate metabolism protein UlaG (beta-lactamase superfamily)
MALVLLTLAWPGSAALAQQSPSTCLAIAEATPQARFADFRDRARPPVWNAALARDEVEITYIHHSTYLIESAGGVRIATDFSGLSGPGDPPDIVTMNHAHSTHYTEFPDPAIPHVLRGWNPAGNGPARHSLEVEDVLVRNVPTDINRFGTFEADGNSIFVFEVAGLCIGHLGHLHHQLTDEDYAAIGRLDVLMVPVDGSWTMSQAGMGEIAERLHSSVVLPMHRFRTPIERFLAAIPDFAVERRPSASLTLSPRTLPRRPTVILLDGV